MIPHSKALASNSRKKKTLQRPIMLPKG